MLFLPLHHMPPFLLCIECCFMMLLRSPFILVCVFPSKSSLPHHHIWLKLVRIFFPPQKHSHNQTCLSSPTVLLQHRNREWTWSLHTHGQSHAERLRMPVFDLCLHHSNLRKTHLNITPPLWDTLEQLFGSLPSSRPPGVHGRPPENPDWGSLSFHSENVWFSWQVGLSWLPNIAHFTHFVSP